MKKKMIVMSVVMASQSYAAFDGSELRGESTKEFVSPRGLIEKCIIPQKINAKNFSKGDIKDEATLCGIDFYAHSLVCPKQNSTNPGILVGEMIDGMSKDDAEKRYCKGPNKDFFGTEAKFKQSISCSYTPSVLAYYQFSRMFDEAGSVPVAVIRTMDKAEHSKQTDRALSYDLSGIIKQTWSSFASEHKKGTNNKIFDETRQFVYGALTENPKREEQYVDVSGRGSYDTRYQRFLKQKPFLNVASSKTVAEIAGATTFEKAAQTIVQMKDVSDMILMDTLFSQDDRIGNIHYKFVWYIIDDKGKVDTKSSKTKLGRNGPVTPAKEIEEYGSKGLLLKQMILKDNDCGVDVTKRSNMMRTIGALEKVRHMSAKTYKRFMSFAQIAKHPDTESWMKRELLFTEADLKGGSRSFQANLDRAVSVLKRNCETGFLKLDLNLQDFVEGSKKTVVNCDGTSAE